MSTMRSAQTVYFGPGNSSYPSAGSVSAGETVTFLWQEGLWNYIQYSVTGTSQYKRGYVPSSSVTITETMLSRNLSSTTWYVTSNCTTYYGPSTSRYPSAGSLSSGESVQHLGVQEGSYVFVQYSITGTSQKKRAWVLKTYLTDAISTSFAPWKYTEGTIINAAGDYWHITRGWNGPTGHLGFDIIRRDSAGVKVEGGEVYAIANGTVVDKGYHSKNGNVIVLRHTTASGKTYHSVYGHLLEYYSNLTTVTRGQAIGRMGNTGSRSNGEHLHLGIARNQSSPAFKGYSYNSAGEQATFTETGPGYKDDVNRYFSPHQYYLQGDSFISNNYS